METVHEAPYSFNTHYVDPRGFCCQVTLRSDDGSDLVKRVNAMLDWLLAQGCLPADRYGNPVAMPLAQATAAANGSNGHASANGNDHGPSWCPIHEVEMRRFEKDGRAWYSHKTDDGGWCKGKAK